MSGTLLMLVFDEEVDDVADEDEPDVDDDEELCGGLKFTLPLLLLLAEVLLVSFSDGEIMPADDDVVC